MLAGTPKLGDDASKLDDEATKADDEASLSFGGLPGGSIAQAATHPATAARASKRTPGFAKVMELLPTWPFSLQRLSVAHPPSVICLSSTCHQCVILLS
jgi:hypothetical protein